MFWSISSFLGAFLSTSSAHTTIFNVHNTQLTLPTPQFSTFTTHDYGVYKSNLEPLVTPYCPYCLRARFYLLNNEYLKGPGDVSNPTERQAIP